jgi:hypothetical protein
VLLLFAIYACSHKPAHAASPTWLAIAAAGKQLQPVMARRQTIVQEFPESFVARTRDCINLNTDVYVLVAAQSSTQEEAGKQLSQLKRRVPDAYLRRCDARESSLISLGIPTVHPSVWQVPAEAVNWGDEDRTTELKPLGGRRLLLVEREYRKGEDSPREGRTEIISYLADGGGQRIVLERDCFDIGRASLSANRIAFHCASGAAAETTIHTTNVYDLGSGKRIVTQKSCRDPKFESANALTCKEETVDGDGELRLRRRRVELPGDSAKGSTVRQN